jgi:hypothetical protein
MRNPVPKPPDLSKKPPLGVLSDGSLMTHRKVSTSAIHDRLKDHEEGAPE